MVTHLVWLRNDLRITDNKALYAACGDPDARVLAVYIATPTQWCLHHMPPRQAAFIHENLLHVQQALAARGIELVIQQCTDFSSSVSWLVHFCQQRHIKALFYNRQYEVNERRRDVQLEQTLSGQVVCHSFDDSLLLPPGRVKTGQGEMYKVYTPFRRAFLQQLAESDVSSLPAPRSRGGPWHSVRQRGSTTHLLRCVTLILLAKRQRYSGCVIFAVSEYRTMRHSEIFLPLSEPANRPQDDVSLKMPAFE